MALRTARFLPGRPDRPKAGLAGLALGIVFVIAPVIALVIALGGCSGPVEAWRSLSGASKNDPDPQTAPFSGNLAAGEAAPYPNLASVPPPPVRATNTAERQKLVQSLIADRDATAALAGPLPPRPAAAAKPAPGLPAATLAAEPAAAAVAAAPATSPRPRTLLNSVPSGRRAAGEPPEPGSLDSSLQMPQIRSVPEPEAMRPPPPPPALPSVPRPVAVADPLPAAAAAAAMPQPAPPEPVLAPVAPPPAAAKPDSQSSTGPKRPPAATTVATLQIPGAAGEPGGQDRAQIARVAALYRDNPGTVRVVAYAAAASGGGDPLDSYRAALDRAQAVAKALAEAGIPASRIQTEAAPAAGAKAGRVEIQFTQ